MNLCIVINESQVLALILCPFQWHIIVSILSPNMELPHPNTIPISADLLLSAFPSSSSARR
jgi:hypothetical protein